MAKKQPKVKKDPNNMSEISQLKAMFSSEIIVLTRKLDEIKGNSNSLIQIYSEMIKHYEEKSTDKKEKKEEPKDSSK